MFFQIPHETLGGGKHFSHNLNEIKQNLKEPIPMLSSNDRKQSKYQPYYGYKDEDGEEWPYV